MLNLKISRKKEDKSSNEIKIPLYDLSQLPEEYLRNEFPEEWRALQKEKKYYGLLWYS
jgi:hypothetical protein